MGLLVFGLLIVCCFLFPLPIKIAARRGHPDVNKIFFVVFFAGWTVVGWVTASSGLACQSEAKRGHSVRRD
jgi:Superinfection immunity protein